MELRKFSGALGLVVAGMLLAAGCGGTLEGKHRRGELTTTTTGATTTTTTTTVPTAGNAAGQTAQGESRRLEPGGILVRSAAWRIVVLPLGGRHR